MPFTQSEPTTGAPEDDPQAPKKPSRATCHSNPSSSVSSRHDRRVLVVGDGNFSYSLALLKQSQQQQQQQQQSDRPNHFVDLIATSYDSYDELVAKYPESRRICAQLRARGATVWHRVDATNLRESLVAAGASQQQLRFDAVIFNHPHVGEENVRRHQSLLSHFYASALAVLAQKESPKETKRDGILLTLAHGQRERWQAVQRALRHGLVLYREVDDVDRDEVFGLVYDRKRHQNGRSFHQVTLYGEKRAQKSTLFIFRRPERAATEAVAVDATRASTAEVVSRDEQTSRKRKAESDHVLEFACTQCDRRFKSTQGLRTHVHMVHELGAGGAGQAVLLHCKLCSRTFKTEDAKRQHVLAKHGNDPLIQPDWFQKQQHEASSAASDPTALSPSLGTDRRTCVSTARAAPLSKAKTCAICDLSFATVEEYDAHWQELQPRPAAAKRKCFNCSREFDDERALRQHQNFCGQKDADGVTKDTDT